MLVCVQQMSEGMEKKEKEIHREEEGGKEGEQRTWEEGKTRKRKGKQEAHFHWQFFFLP